LAIAGAVETVRFADGAPWNPSALTARIAGEIGSDADDVLNASSVSSLLRGFAGADVLSGFEGADTLDGGPGFDIMSGGTGDDTYYIDSAGDQVIETAGSGTDTVISTIDLTLGANVERLQLAGTRRCACRQRARQRADRQCQRDRLEPAAVPMR
jgi:Ca2+-binding RTX toxin-like protein